MARLQIKFHMTEHLCWGGPLERKCLACLSPRGGPWNSSLWVLCWDWPPLQHAYHTAPTSLTEHVCSSEGGVLNSACYTIWLICSVSDPFMNYNMSGLTHAAEWKGRVSKGCTWDWSHVQPVSSEQCSDAFIRDFYKCKNLNPESADRLFCYIFHIKWCFSSAIFISFYFDLLSKYVICYMLFSY